MLEGLRLLLLLLQCLVLNPKSYPTFKLIAVWTNNVWYLEDGRRKIGTAATAGMPGPGPGLVLRHDQGDGQVLPGEGQLQVL